MSLCSLPFDILLSICQELDVKDVVFCGMFLIGVPNSQHFWVCRHAQLCVSLLKVLTCGWTSCGTAARGILYSGMRSLPFVPYP